MGTRHLIAAKIGGEYKIAQYGQWDGYPSGQGVTVLAFAQGMDRPSFEAKLRAASFMTDDEYKAWVIEANSLGGGESGFSRPSWAMRWPWMSRDAGAKILAMVSDQPAGIKLHNSLSFAADSLFCEWAYVLDFDLNTFEVFKGFNTDGPLVEGDRFYGGVNSADGEADYHGIKLLHTWPLDALPTEAEFLKVLEPPDEDTTDNTAKAKS